MVMNNNTYTVLVDEPPTEFLPEQPHPDKTIHNVYELKTQPELVRYLHAAAGYPTKPIWIEAIKNKQFASWPGLTVKAVTKNLPESEETQNMGPTHNERILHRECRRTLQVPQNLHQ